MFLAFVYHSFTSLFLLTYFDTSFLTSLDVLSSSWPVPPISNDSSVSNSSHSLENLKVIIVSSPSFFYVGKSVAAVLSLYMMELNSINHVSDPCWSLSLLDKISLSWILFISLINLALSTNIFSNGLSSSDVTSCQAEFLWESSSE